MSALISRVAVLKVPFRFSEGKMHFFYASTVSWPRKCDARTLYNYGILMAVIHQSCPNLKKPNGLNNG
jgi:hypothetical protein